MRKRLMSIFLVFAILFSVSITNTNAAQVGTRTNPYNAYNSTTINFQRLWVDEVKKVNLQVQEVYVGDIAKKMILDSNSGNTVPKSDEQWIIYKMRIKYISGSEEKLNVKNIINDDNYGTTSFTTQTGASLTSLGSAYFSNGFMKGHSTSETELFPGSEAVVYAKIMTKKSNGIPMFNVQSKSSIEEYNIINEYQWFKVGAPSASSVNLNTYNATLSVGKGFQAKATVYPTNANNRSVTWRSSSPSIASVDSNGNIKALKAGYTYIIAKTSNGIERKCLVKVITPQVQPVSVKMNISSTTLSIGKSFTARATVSPLNATNKSVTYSSTNSNVAKVDASGKVTAVGVGTAYIKASTINSKVGQIKVVVVSNAAQVGTRTNPYNAYNSTTINFQRHSFDEVKKVNLQVQEVYTGEEANLIVQAANRYNKVPNNDEQWILYKIRVKYVSGPEKKLSVWDVIYDNPYSSDFFTKADGSSLKPIDNASFTENNYAQYSPMHAYLYPGNETVVYASILTKKSVGIPMFKIKSNASYDNEVYSWFKVGAPSASSVNLNAYNATLSIGKGFQAKATVYPTNANNRSVTWRSSSPSIASVDANGNVKALKAGYTYIIAKTSNGIERKCLVKVITPQVQPVSVKMNISSTTLSIGKSFTARATVSPSNATNKSVTYSSTNSNVAKVDASGKVTTIGAGTCYINAKTSNGKMGQIKVTVLPNPTSVSISPKSATVSVGRTFKATSIVTPSNAVKNVTYSSSSPTIATIDANGNVKAIKAGYTYISVKTHNGKTARFLLRVV